MKVINKFLVLIFTLLSAVVQAQHPKLLEEEGWEIKKEKYDIKIYSKSLDEYKIKAFKAVGFIEADINAVYNAVMDIEGYTEWYPDCSKGRNIEENDSVQVRQIVFDLPWPLDDRGAVNKIVTRLEGNRIWMEIVNAYDYIPKEKKVVRIPGTEGYWLLEPTENGTTLTYSAVGEAPGVPAWIVNLFVFDSPVEAMNNLRNIVKQDKYQFVPSILK